MCGCLAQERQVKKVRNSLTWFSHSLGDCFVVGGVSFLFSNLLL